MELTYQVWDRQTNNKKASFQEVINVAKERNQRGMIKSD